MWTRVPRLEDPSLPVSFPHRHSTVSLPRRHSTVQLPCVRSSAFLPRRSNVPATACICKHKFMFLLPTSTRPEPPSVTLLLVPTSDHGGSNPFSSFTSRPTFESSSAGFGFFGFHITPRSIRNARIRKKKVNIFSNLYVS